MAQNLVRSVTIHAPADKVFSFLSDPTHWMLAFPGDSEVTDVNIAPDGNGTSARWSARILGLPLSVTHEYRDVVPGKRIVSRASVGPVLTFSLEPVDGGTQLGVEQGLDIHTPLVRVPVQALFARWSENDIDALAANIKSMVESGIKAAAEAGRDIMSSTPSAVVEAHPVLRRYYTVLRGGAGTYQDGRDLLPLLADDFEFDGPIAGTVSGGARFAQGARGFVENVKGMSVLQAVSAAGGAAVLYDAELPGGAVRFSEFFEFDGGRIRRLRLQYDAADYVAKGGR